MKEKFVKAIIIELNNRYKNNPERRVKELDKLLRFAKSSDYFKGKKKKIYSIISNARKS